MLGHSHEAADGAGTPQGNIELMPKKEVLDFKLTPRPEQVGDERPEQLEDRKHRTDDAPILPHRANQQGWNFRERQVMRFTWRP